MIACEVLAREMYHLASRADRVVNVSLLPKGLHGLGAAKMRARLQAEIDSTDGSRYEGIALGYALSSRGTEGLAANDVPVVIPRAHDCITLLLGGRERYMAEFEAHAGTYYCSGGWHERDAEDGGAPDRPAGGGPGLVAGLGMDGDYVGPDGDFVFIAPGESIAATNDDMITECARCRSG